MNKPLILVTNDDGITSNGIRVLVEVMARLGEVIVVAPDSPQSGMGHAITVGNTLRLSETKTFNGIKSFQCSGTPVDCVKLAKHYVLKDRKPDLLVSGINHGPNTSISVVYSGTMAAALEAAIDDIPAIGFSVCDYSQSARFEHVSEYLEEISKYVLESGLTRGVALNVNFPAAKQGPIRGIRICRQAKARWKEAFDERLDPYGERYFWMAGDFINMDEQVDNDIWAIANNYVSVVPTQFDMTAHHIIQTLKGDFEVAEEPEPGESRKSRVEPEVGFKDDERK
jgi:5'-nucleotidase